MSLQELNGLKFEAHDRYDGDLDYKGRYHGHGVLYTKLQGYHEEETVLYEGNFERGVYNGQVSLNSYLVSFVSGCATKPPRPFLTAHPRACSTTKVRP